MSCIDNCLQANDLQFFAKVGYYSCLGDEINFDENQIEDALPEASERNKKSALVVFKTHRKIWIDLLNEAIELSYIYASEIVLNEQTSPFGYSLNRAIREAKFSKKIEVDLDFSKTCSEVVMLIASVRDENQEEDDNISPHNLLSPEMNVKGQFWQSHGRRMSMMPSSPRREILTKNIEKSRKSVVIVHHKDSSVKIIHPMAAIDSD